MAVYKYHAEVGICETAINPFEYHEVEKIAACYYFYDIQTPQNMFITV